MQRVVAEQGLGFIATVCPDGTPNLSPKGTTRVWDDDHLVFADVCSPGTMANLAANPATEINVVDPITRTGYRFKGRAELHSDGAVFEDALALYERAGSLSVARMRAVALVTVESAAPLISPAYDTGLTREQVVDRSYRRLEQVYGITIS
jgi:predicted pyridoxine 5'-phosphate oxidase superfamily flavin-nucleotide-binding protein